MNRKSFWIFISALHAMFFMKQMLVYNSLIQDSVEYIFAADNLLNKGTLYAWNMNFAFNADWLTKRPILYPLILLIFKWLSFGNQWLFFFITYLVQNLLSLNAIRLCLKIADRYKASYNWWQITLFLALSTSQIIYANLVMSEIWLQAAMLGIVYLLVMQPFSTLNFLKMAALLSAGLLIKPVLLFACILLPFIYLLMRRQSTKLPELTISLLPLMLYFLVSGINYKRTGHFQYSSITTINLLHYNTYVTLMSEYGTQKADSIIDHIKIATREMSYSDKQKYLESEAKAQLSAHLPKYAWLHSRGIFLALLDPGRFDYTQFFHLPHKTNLIYQSNQKGMLGTILKSFLNPLGFWLMVLFLFNLFRLLKGIQFIFNKHIEWPLKLAVMAFPVYILLFTGPIGTSRFFMPLIPFAFLMFVLAKHKNTEE